MYIQCGLWGTFSVNHEGYGVYLNLYVKLIRHSVQVYTQWNILFIFIWRSVSFFEGGGGGVEWLTKNKSCLWDLVKAKELGEMQATATCSPGPRAGGAAHTPAFCPLWCLTSCPSGRSDTKTGRQKPNLSIAERRHARKQSLKQHSKEEEDDTAFTTEAALPTRSPRSAWMIKLELFHNRLSCFMRVEVHNWLSTVWKAFKIRPSEMDLSFPVWPL